MSTNKTYTINKPTILYKRLREYPNTVGASIEYEGDIYPVTLQYIDYTPKEGALSPRLELTFKYDQNQQGTPLYAWIDQLQGVDTLIADNLDYTILLPNPKGKWKYTQAVGVSPNRDEALIMELPLIEDQDQDTEPNAVVTIRLLRAKSGRGMYQGVATIKDIAQTTELIRCQLLGKVVSYRLLLNDKELLKAVILPQENAHVRSIVDDNTLTLYTLAHTLGHIPLRPSKDTKVDYVYGHSPNNKGVDTMLGIRISYQSDIEGMSIEVTLGV